MRKRLAVENRKLLSKIGWLGGHNAQEYRVRVLAFVTGCACFAIIGRMGFGIAWNPLYGPLRALNSVWLDVVAALVLLIVAIAIAALGGGCISGGVLVTCRPNLAGTRAVRVIVSKRRISIAISDVAEFCAMFTQKSRMAGRKALITEFVHALDYAVDLPGDRPIDMMTEALDASTAQAIGLYGTPLHGAERVGFAVLFGPLTAILRRVSGGHRYRLVTWRLDRDAYLSFRRSARATRLLAYVRCLDGGGVDRSE